MLVAKESTIPFAFVNHKVGFGADQSVHFVAAKNLKEEQAVPLVGNYLVFTKFCDLTRGLSNLYFETF